MGSLGAKLTEELNSATAFVVPVFGGIEVSESTVVSWIIIGVIFLLCLFLTSGLKVHQISKRQAFAEFAVVKLQGIVDGILGEEGKQYGAYLITVLIYLAVANLIGLAGFTPPTKDLCVTAGLAIMSIVLIEYAGIHQKGFRGWLKSFTQPMAILTPINIMEVFIKPLSLCMRLFGNVLGAFVVMELIKTVLPVVLPIPFSCYFDIFDGLIQAYVFVFLTGLFIKEAIE